MKVKKNFIIGDDHDKPKLEVVKKYQKKLNRGLDISRLVQF